MRVSLIALCTLSTLTVSEFSRVAEAEPDLDAAAPDENADAHTRFDRESSAIVGHPSGVNPEARPTVFFSASACLEQDDDDGEPESDRPFDESSAPPIRIQFDAPLGSDDCEEEDAASDSPVRVNFSDELSDEPDEEPDLSPAQADSVRDSEPSIQIDLSEEGNAENAADREAEVTSDSEPSDQTHESAESAPPVRVDLTDDGFDLEIADHRPDGRSPIQRPQPRLFNLETANFLEEGALQLRVGAHQTFMGDRPDSGTGDEVYDGSIDYGVFDDLQIGITANFFDDPPNRAVDGELPNVRLFSIAPHVKYQIVDQERLAIALHGAVEFLLIEAEPGLFNDTRDDEFASVVAGTLQAPLTFNASPDIQLHFTPGIAFTPGEVNGGDFYGTFFNIGTGISWQPSDRVSLYGTLNAPLGPGGNTVDSDDGDIVRQLVWAVGARYAVTPRVGVDLYGTNAFGTTPTTGLLSFIPDGNQTTVGVALTYTPETGLGYGSSFREGDAPPLSDRDTQLLVDGLTLTTANTLQPGMVSVGVGAGFGDRFNVDLAYSPDEDFQIEASLDEFGAEDNVSSDDSGGTDLKYMLGARVRLLDQRRGDPVTLSARLMGGRDTGANNQVGVLFTELPVLYEATEHLALFATPKAAFFADQSRIGLGLGINYALPHGFQLIGEVTPVIDGEPTVWSAGARYHHPDTNLGVDVYVTNSIGRNGLGSLVGESGASVGVNLNWLIGR
ncbi:MAG: hypothetical protein WBA57_26430 [Elainellaceae cyanobacterium]